MVQCNLVLGDLSNVSFTDAVGTRVNIHIKKEHIPESDCVTADIHVDDEVRKYGIAYNNSGMQEVLFGDDEHQIDYSSDRQFENLYDELFQHNRIFPSLYSTKVVGEDCMEAEVTDGSVDLIIDVKDSYNNGPKIENVSTYDVAWEVGRLLVLIVVNGWFGCSTCAAIKNVLHGPKPMSALFKNAEGGK